MSDLGRIPAQESASIPGGDGGRGAGQRVAAALACILPVTVQETPDYAELTFGQSRTQAMTMEPETWLALNDLPAQLTALQERLARAEATADQMGDALMLASVAINAAFAQAQAEYQGHDRTADKHDKTVREGRNAIGAALEAAHAR